MSHPPPPAPAPSRRRQQVGRWPELLLTLPSMVWLAAFFAIPTGIVLLIALRSADPFGGIGSAWTLDTLAKVWQGGYGPIVWRTIWLSLAATGLCLLVGLPVAECLARLPARRRNVLLVFVIVPFWTNFLIRIFAWKAFLHPDGWLKQALVALRLAAPETILLYNSWAVLAVLVYTYLPFAILPIYAAAEKFDRHLIEAAYDLGASRRQAFCRVYLPGILRGVVTAVLMVFIPALGSYVIPEVVGGAGAEMIGNKIAQRVFVDRNLPHASALAGLLMLLVALPLAVRLTLRRQTPAGDDSLL